MADTVLYFFRQQKLLFYFGLLSLTVVYSYFLSLYFLKLSPFLINAFNLLIFFSLIWLILTLRNFSKHKENYISQREEEKYNLLRHQVTLKYKLDIKDNIFSKVDLIRTFMKENFSSKGLLSIRILKVINSSLNLYIENLKIADQLNKALSFSLDADKEYFYQNEIQKNKDQNYQIELNLDSFIKELMSKKNNDKKIENLLNEFEHSTQILTKIQLR